MKTLESNVLDIDADIALSSLGVTHFQTDNLTEDQLHLIKRLAYFAESHCDARSKLYEPDADFDVTWTQRGDACALVWDMCRLAMRALP